MTPADLTPLITRLEGAEEGNWTLEQAIFLGLPKPKDLDEELQDRHYTTSLDAAVALVERAAWRLWTLDHSIPNQPAAMLQGPIKHYPAEGEYPAHDGPAWMCGRARTPPLALCIALLRALAEGEARI
jgi:hypothetical protein